MKLGIVTFGCRLNSLESEAIISSFKDRGWTVNNKEEEDDDLIIINTCTVTSKSDQEARRIIRHFGNSIPTIVTGCYANLEQTSEIEGLGAKVKVIKDKSELLRNYSNINDISDREESDEHKFDFDVRNFAFHSRASIKIQDGCDNNCSYCAVHLARGKSVSLNPDTIKERIKALEDNGNSEITLVGVNVASYNYNGVNISHLLEEILPSLRRNTRIRLSSIEPDYIDDLFYDVVKDEHIFPFFHLPLQSVSKRVLEKAGRKYDESDLQKIVDNLKKAKDNPYIAADIISGLPYEEDKDAEITYNFLKDNRFSRLHVFPFSPRKGTDAYSMKHPPERIRDERAKRLNDLSKDLYASYIESNISKTLEAVTERKTEIGTFVTTANYIKAHVDGLYLDEGKIIRGTLIKGDGNTLKFANIRPL